MKEFYDSIIIGGGPAGLSAAIYMARARYKVLVIEKEKIGGQITITSEVVNYPGVPITDGKELTEKMREQAQNFGAEFLLADVLEADVTPGGKRIIKTDKGDYQTLGLIVATGASPRKIGFTGEREFQGRGVAYCATCDGEFFTGMDIFVIGGGFAAAEEAIFLTNYGKKVTIMVREDDFTCAGTIVDEVLKHPDIEVHYNTEIIEAGGGSGLRYAVFKNNKSGQSFRYEPKKGETFGIFVFAGYIPATDLFKGKLELDKNGYLITDANQKTSIDGIYGAGDVCIKNLRQVVTAVSDGAIAATSMEKYVSEMYDKLSLPKRVTNKETMVKKTQVQKTDLDDQGFITEAMKAQLEPIFAKFTSKVLVKGYLDDSKVSEEVKGFLSEVDGLSDKVICQISEEVPPEIETYPAIVLYNEKGEYQRVQFHGVPGGHEFNSFIVALYNVAGPGQPQSLEVLDAVKSLKQPARIRIFVSLSCTMCPELVMAAQRIAIENTNIEAQMYDLANYPEVKERYNIMSVPCMLVNDKIHFGKKGIMELVEILKLEAENV